jgi:Fe-S-cluster containining protein
MRQDVCSETAATRRIGRPPRHKSSLPERGTIPRRAQSLLDSDDSRDSIHCDRCQACCCQLQVILMPHDAPPPHLVEIEEHGLSVMRQRDDGWCVALDRETMRCSIYAQRPQVCRDFATGSRECRAERDQWRRAAIAITLR